MDPLAAGFGRSPPSPEPPPWWAAFIGPSIQALEGGLVTPARVDEVVVRALDGPEKLEPLEPVGVLDGVGPGREALLQRLALFLGDGQYIDLDYAHGLILPYPTGREGQRPRREPSPGSARLLGPGPGYSGWVTVSDHRTASCEASTPTPNEPHCTTPGSMDTESTPALPAGQSTVNAAT